jgi:hypothetical protein
MEEIKSPLAVLRVSSLRFRSKAGPALASATSLADILISGESRARVALDGEIDNELARKLVSASGYLAERAVNEHDAIWLTRAFACNALAAGKEDEREQIRHLVLVAAAAEAINVDYTPLLCSVASRASERASLLLRRFSTRPRELNRLEDFGIRARQIDGDFQFHPVDALGSRTTSAH